MNCIFNKGVKTIKKILAIFMALIMALGCTVMAGAETVDAETARMNEIAEEIIDTLPADMQGKDFEIVDGEDDGFSTALMATESATAETIQGLIDDGAIVAGEFEIEGLSVEVVEMDAIVPYVENDGELYNALNGVSATAAYNENYWNSGWNGYASNGTYVYGRVQGYRYTDSNGYLVAVRPLSISSKFSGELAVSSMYSNYTAWGTTRAYPGFINGTDNGNYGAEYSIEYTTSNPVSGETYPYSTNMQNRCVQLNNNGQNMHIILYQFGAIKAEVFLSF